MPKKQLNGSGILDTLKNVGNHFSDEFSEPISNLARNVAHGVVDYAPLLLGLGRHVRQLHDNHRELHDRLLKLERGGSGQIGGSVNSEKVFSDKLTNERMTRDPNSKLIPQDEYFDKDQMANHSANKMLKDTGGSVKIGGSKPCKRKCKATGGNADTLLSQVLSPFQ